MPKGDSRRSAITLSSGTNRSSWHGTVLATSSHCPGPDAIPTAQQLTSDLVKHLALIESCYLFAASWSPGSGPLLDKSRKVATMATRGDAMSAVGIKELKNRLTHYLRRTKQGEEVVVTERGKPIALIQPIRSASDAASREARLARLAALGLVTLPTRQLRKRIRPVKVSGPPVSQAILEDRR
jgi:prevent-host-death family protein